MTYQDCTIVPLSGPTDMDRVIPAFFLGAPGWLHRLMDLRNALVRPLGLKTGPMGPPPPPPYHVGQSIGLFRLLSLTEDEAVLGEDDRHLDFRVSLKLLPDRRLAVSTHVTMHNGLGRAYMAVVKPVHRIIAPIVARNMAELLSITPTDATG